MQYITLEVLFGSCLHSNGEFWLLHHTNEKIKLVFNAVERPTIKFPKTDLHSASQIKELVVHILMSFVYYMYLENW